MFQHSEVFQKGIVHRTNCPFTDVFVIISTIFGLFIILCMAIHLFFIFFKVCVKKVEYPIMELCVHAIQTLNTTFLLVDGICIVHVNILVQSVPL